MTHPNNVCLFHCGSYDPSNLSGSFPRPTIRYGTMPLNLYLLVRKSAAYSPLLLVTTVSNQVVSISTVVTSTLSDAGRHSQHLATPHVTPKSMYAGNWSRVLLLVVPRGLRTKTIRRHTLSHTIHI
jgi:hypothetical protein